MKIRPAVAAMRQGTAQTEQGRTAGHKSTMRPDNMRPQSGQQVQGTSTKQTRTAAADHQTAHRPAGADRERRSGRKQDQTADTAREKIPAFVRLRYFRPSRSNGQEAGKPCAVYICGGCSWCMCDQIRHTPAPVRRLFAA